jgi:DNA-binding transcriptional MerR regulator
MKIGELANLSGMAPSRIRYYETKGLFEAVDRRSNGYREYPKETLTILGIINAAKQAGFSLGEIKALLPNGTHSWNREELIASLEKKVKDIILLQEQLNHTKGELLRFITFVKTRPKDSVCADNLRDALDTIQAAPRDRKRLRTG